MKEHAHVPSLLPYLHPANACTLLKIPLSCEDPTCLEGPRFPFRVVSDADPLTRLIGAQFETDSGSLLRKVFLLMQRDNYSVTHGQLSPVTNSNIEDFWQNAFAYYSNHNNDSSFITLSRQVSGESTLVPFQSLFYCKSRDFFFHPPCPQCGLDLMLCKDDAFLERLGLPKYTSSIFRFLYCPSCSSSTGRAQVYAYDTEHFNMPMVKDPSGLIRDFHQLAAGGKGESLFPCAECPRSGECYGANGSAPSRIVPFSFYPFYMLVFESMPVNALDFLVLLSGASPEDLETRMRFRGDAGKIPHFKDVAPNLPNTTLFLFPEDDRFFLEVFYLKLSFLGELLQETISESISPGFYDPLVAIDRTWVRLSDQRSLLPLFWDFELKFLDIFRPPQEQLPFPKPPMHYSLHFLGLLWFHVFLANSRQDTAKIYETITRLYDKAVVDLQMPLDPGTFLGTDPVFHPENIFWNPEGRRVRSQWHGLWEQTLNLGCSLLRASFHAASGWSKINFLKQLEKVRWDVKSELFTEKPIPGPPERFLDNETIRNILTGIMKKWGDAQAEIIQPDENFFETVVVSSRSSEEETLPLHLATKDREEPLPETLILSPGKPTEAGEGSPEPSGGPEAAGAEREGPAQEDGLFDETMIVGAAHAEPREEIPDTLVLFPSKDRKPSRETPPEAAAPDRAAHTESQAPPGPLAPLEPDVPEKKPSEEELMMETIILTPPKHKGSDKDKKGSHE